MHVCCTYIKAKFDALESSSELSFLVCTKDFTRILVSAVESVNSTNKQSELLTLASKHNQASTL